MSRCWLHNSSSFDPLLPVGSAPQLSAVSGYATPRLILRSSYVHLQVAGFAWRARPVPRLMLSSDLAHRIRAGVGCFAVTYFRFVVGVFRPPSFDDFPAPYKHRIRIYTYKIVGLWLRRLIRNNGEKLILSLQTVTKEKSHIKNSKPKK